MKADGTMARVPDLIEFCNEHGLKMLTVAELIRYRLQNERYIYRVARIDHAHPFGEFRMIAYESEVDGGESHVALVMGDVATATEPVLVRVHSRCTEGDIFGATSCECYSVMQRSLKAIADAGRGALVYLHNTSRGFQIDRSVPPRAPRLSSRTASTGAAGGEKPAHPSRGGLGRPDPLRPQHPQDPPALQHADAHSGARGLRSGDR